MGSNGGDEVMISGTGDAECPEATVEIKIKTLDSQTYTLRVDKRVPVPALKEQIATVTGVLSEQQRLICRGKVLKDDQLLSAYHVEDGHTLHLVVRQPIPPSSESSADRSATDPASSSGGSQGSRFASSVVVRTFNISEQRDGGFPDVNRIISAVLDSFGMTSTGSGSEGSDLREPTSERILRTQGLGVFRNPHSDQSSTRGQSNPHNSASPLPTAIPNESLQPPVIPDSLTTLSQYLSRMRHEFSANELGVRDQSSQAAGTRGTHRQGSDTASQSTAGWGGLPTPASLAEVMLSTRQVLMEQAVVYLSQLMRQLEDHANVTDPLARMTIQSDAMRSGVLLQNLGALLLELGRTTMTLRMGQTPADAVVNAGPAVFISTSGPNPIMVQPLPFQPGSSFGSIPMGTVQPSSGISSGSHGSGLLPRNIDIRIHAGSLMPSVVVNQRESSGNVQQSPRQTNPEASGSPSSTRESEVRVVPFRTVIAAVPAPVRRSPSDSSRGSVGLFYPVLARVQRGNLNGTRDSQPSNERNHGDLDTAVQEQNVGFPEADGGGMQNGEGITQNHSGLDQLLRTIFPGEHIHVDDANFQEMNADSTRGHGETTHDPPNTHEAAPRVVDDATFLSNLLRQIMPIISQGTAIGSTTESLEGADDDAEDRSTQVSSIHDQQNSDRGNSSRRPCDPPSPPMSKRQKRE